MQILSASVFKYIYKQIYHFIPLYIYIYIAQIYAVKLNFLRQQNKYYPKNLAVLSEILVKRCPAAIVKFLWYLTKIFQ